MDFKLGNAKRIPFIYPHQVVGRIEGQPWPFRTETLRLGVDSYREKYEILAMAQRKSVIIDVGCAHGCWTSEAEGAIPEGAIKIGVDPMSDVNLPAFTCYYRCAIDNVDKDTKATFNLFDEPGCNSLLKKSCHLDRKVTGSIEVDVRSLESILKERFPHGIAVHYAKCDCQGKDMDVVRSLRSFLPSTNYIQIESSFSREKPFYEGQGYCEDDVAEMDKLGFEPLFYVVYESVLPEGEILFGRKNP